MSFKVKNNVLVACWVLVGLIMFQLAPQISFAQRDDDSSNDDFDDPGFDNTGYGQPSQDSNANGNYDAEGSNQQPASASEVDDDDNDDDIDESRVFAVQVPTGAPQTENAHPSFESDFNSKHRPLNRAKRYAKNYIGPVYTFVKTDKKAHFKWGVKHKVGKKYGRRQQTKY